MELEGSSRRTTVRRAFVGAWVFFSLAGALNHTVAMKACGTRYDLMLPHLRYGYVMFNKNPTTVYVFEYAREDGVRHNVADLVAVPAIGYKRARVAVALVFAPKYLNALCFREMQTGPSLEMTFYIDVYDVTRDPRRPIRQMEMLCDKRGFRPKNQPSG